MVLLNFNRCRLLCALSLASMPALAASIRHAGEFAGGVSPPLPAPASIDVSGHNAVDTVASFLHLDRVGRYFEEILQDSRFLYDWSPDDPTGWPGRGDPSDGGGGLFGDDDDGNSFVWGGSTLEVVVSQIRQLGISRGVERLLMPDQSDFAQRTSAMYMTRVAAFGPRITTDDGLRGSLIPISEFYHVPSLPKRKEAALKLPDNTACPYPGGPGWEEDGSEGPNIAERYVTSTKSAPPKDWIALVERGGNCSFVAKVRVSIALGAQAVVIGDAPSPNWKGSDDPEDNSDPGATNKRPLTMFASGDTTDINITSTFVTRPSYLDLLRLVEEVETERCRSSSRYISHTDHKDDRRGLEIILARNDISWEWPLIDLALLLLLLPSAMTVASIIVHRIRLARQRRKDRAPETVVLALPCLIWRSDGLPWEKATGKDDGDLRFSTSSEPNGATSASDAAADAGPSRSNHPPQVSVAPASPGSSHAFLPAGRAYYGSECTICLSDFQDGDRVRVLPCGHIFHRNEIDDWLIRIRKTCPLCSRDCTVAVPPMPIVAQDVQPGVGASAVLQNVVVDPASPSANERTPLLERSTSL